MRRMWVGGLGCVLAVACGGPVNPADTVPSTSTGGGGEATQGMSETGVPTSGGSTGAPASTGGLETGSTTSTTSTSSSSEVSGEASSGTTCDFICSRGDMPDECNVWAQDCPRGEKCSAYANDGGNSWNDAKCVPVMENPQQPGEPCFVVGNGVSGIDNCDLGSMCWDTDAENNGVCVALCKGTPESMFCEAPGTVCATCGDCVLNLCLETCDPLTQGCLMDDDVCIGNPSGDGFLCVHDASGEEGQQHDPCEFANSCDDGLVCLNSTAASECDPMMASGCCQPFCDLSVPNPDTQCTGQGQKCEPYFVEGMAPPGSEDVGVCAIPM